MVDVPHASRRGPIGRSFEQPEGRVFLSPHAVQPREIEMVVLLVCIHARTRAVEVLVVLKPVHIPHQAGHVCRDRLVGASADKLALAADEGSPSVVLKACAVPDQRGVVTPGV